MIGPAPKYKWHEYLVKTGEIPVANKKRRDRGDLPYVLFGLDPKASDDLKLDYERFQRKMFGGLAKFYVPDMEDPYYTWDGKIVERSSLKGRKLPLAD